MRVASACVYYGMVISELAGALAFVAHINVFGWADVDFIVAAA